MPTLAVSERAPAADEPPRELNPLATHGARTPCTAGMHGRLDELARANALLEAEIREQRCVAAELRQAKERLTLALESSRLSLWDFDIASGRLYLSKWWAEMLGDTAQETHTTIAELFALTHPTEREGLNRHYKAAVEGSTPEYCVEHRVLTRTGHWKWVQSLGRVTERAANGRALRMIGTNVDITERKRAEELVRESEQRFRDVVEASGEYVWETDAQWRYRYLSRRAEAVLGYSIDALLGRTPAELMPPGEAERVERWIGARAVSGGGFSNLEHTTMTPSGEIRWQSVSCKPVRDDCGKVIAYRGTGANITDRKQHEARIQELATRDALTGLPNRALLRDRLEHAIVAGRRQHGLLATMFIDVDRFKSINDSLGHPIGDALLRQMAARLTGSVREEDTVARPGGDEFVVIASGMRHVDDVAQLARTLLRGLNAPYIVEGHQLVASCSIGISLYPTDGTQIDLLLKHADTAMYHAKAAGGDGYRFFSTEMNVRALERLGLENDLRRALESDGLQLEYQPIVDMENGRPVVVEALARWQKPDGTVIPPSRFIAIAEETGLIIRLGEWALAKACHQAKRWHEAGHPGIKIAVNVSPSQLRDGRGFARRVAAILGETALDPRCLDLEVTESLLMIQAESNFESLRRIADLGVQWVVDDFGTGYSSLSYLKRLPIRGLKIAQSFVRDIENDADDAAIVSAVVSLARSLDLHVTAEGVESDGQLAALRRLGCDRWQGYLRSEPLSAAALGALLRGDASG